MAGPYSNDFPHYQDYEIYLIKEYRYLHDAVLLEAVAGTVNSGEDFLDAAKRELQEEAGITAQNWRPLTQLKLAGSYIDAQVSLFLAQELSIGIPHLEDDEEIEVVKMPIAKAVEKVFHHEIVIPSAITGILWIDKMIQEGKL